MVRLSPALSVPKSPPSILVFFTPFSLSSTEENNSGMRLSDCIEPRLRRNNPQRAELRADPTLEALTFSIVGLRDAAALVAVGVDELDLHLRTTLYR